jgi:death-on-curing protein
LYHLLKINLTPSAKQKDFEILAIRIASNELSKYPNFSRWDNVYDGEVHFIADFLRKNTRTTKKNEYIITYRDLNSILIRYSFELVNPVDNRIDIVSNREETVGLIKRKRIIITKRIGTIDFLGWGRQVNVKDIKYVRKLTGLTHDNGIDSEVFFHNAEPFNSLILQYQNPLKRLADK